MLKDLVREGPLINSFNIKIYFQYNIVKFEEKSQLIDKIRENYFI